MNINTETMPPGTLIVVPDGDARYIKSGEQFINGSGEIAVWLYDGGSQHKHQPVRVLTPSEFAEMLAPKLPEVGSVWRTKGGWSRFIMEGVREGEVFTTCSKNNTDGDGRFFDAESFASWVLSNSATCVYAPSQGASK